MRAAACNAATCCTAPAASELPACALSRPAATVGLSCQASAQHTLLGECACLPAHALRGKDGDGVSIRARRPRCTMMPRDQAQGHGNGHDLPPARSIPGVVDPCSCFQRSPGPSATMRPASPLARLVPAPGARRLSASKRSPFGDPRRPRPPQLASNVPRCPGAAGYAINNQHEQKPPVKKMSDKILPCLCYLSSDASKPSSLPPE